MTPVKPLATMGCGGGPLRCEVCLMPILLEGGKFHKVYADRAWEINPDRENGKWLSYISGGLVVQIAENGTLRIYHGYDGRPADCCTKGMGELRAASDKFVRDNSKASMIFKYIEHRFPDLTLREHNAMLTDVMNVMFSFDPGLGVNQPSPNCFECGGQADRRCEVGPLCKKCGDMRLAPTVQPL